MARYLAIDANNIVVGVLDVTDEKDLAINQPENGRLVRSSLNVEIGKTKYVTHSKSFEAMAVSLPTPEQVLKTMLDVIDDERTMLMRPLLTTGQEIKYEYANKAREVRDYRLLSGAVVANLLIPLNIGATRDRFAWAMAERDETGEDLETIITRWETAMKRTILTTKIAARAQKLKRAISAAKDANGNPDTAAQKKIFDARVWPTT